MKGLGAASSHATAGADLRGVLGDNGFSTTGRRNRRRSVLSGFPERCTLATDGVQRRGKAPGARQLPSEEEERLPPPRAVSSSRRRRLTPGLRREEDAARAGVGTTWYTWLEQARDIRPAERALRSSARARGIGRSSAPRSRVDRSAPWYAR